MAETASLALAKAEAEAMHRMSKHQDSSRAAQAQHHAELKFSQWSAIVKQESVSDRLSKDVELKRMTLPLQQSKKLCDNRFQTDAKVVGSWVATKAYRDRMKNAKDRANLWRALVAMLIRPFLQQLLT